MNFNMNRFSGFDDSAPSRTESKSSGFSLSFLLSKNKREAQVKKTSVSQIKLQLELSFQDIGGQDAERLRYKVRGSHEARELWMLRSDAYQLIAHHASQQEAASRINKLLPSFEGWLPAKTLVKI